MDSMINVPERNDEKMNLRIIADYPDLYDPDQEEAAGEPVDITTEKTTGVSEGIPAKESAENVLEEKQEEREVKYEIAGVWDEYESSTGLPNRNTWPLSDMKGLSMKICKPVYSDFLNSVGDMRYYDAIPLSPSLEIRDAVLPAGRYRIRYSIRDMLDKTYTSDFFCLTWDGEQVVYEKPDAAEEQSEKPEAA